MQHTSSRLLTLAVACAAIVASTTSCPAEDAEQIPDDIKVIYNIRYRDGAVKNWTLDLALPKAPLEKPRPAIVVIHGGGWIQGDKSSFSTPQNRPPGNIIDFARLGFVAATINYRLADAEQVGIETADQFVVSLNRAGRKDVSYHRLALTGHCPHSIQRVKYLQPVVNEFFLRTLAQRDSSPKP